MKNTTNSFNLKKAVFPFLTALILIIITISCSSSDNGNSLPTAIKFNKLKTDALNSLTQHFQFNTADGYASFTSSKGVQISFSAIALSLNGNPVTGTIDIEYIEIFDGGNMLVTGKHTMGKMPDGNHSLLLSGGEFYINATKNGQQLELQGTITLGIPTNLTDGDNGGNPNMTLWNKTENDSVWVPNENNNPAGANGVELGQGQIATGNGFSIYYAYVGTFGWTNVDCFYNYTGPKTTILASVPNGYTDQNSAIYLHYDGKGNALAKLDTYDTTTGLFTEHYGQIPIGLACHIIFATEDNGHFRYAIKAVTISAGEVYNFTLSETTVGTQEQLTAAINALP
ncbi:hypothetical protein [Flavobacterium sp. N1994]|uniref:hypothetical protein n=1 Tax=Flavobacterium sp. N1994 TaxID=2986827 RepID=UPI002222CD66|nr:hypothetical protein [Flavobacterium sp. N1994]